MRTPNSGRNRVTVNPIEVDNGDCVILQVLSPDPAQFDILQPLEEFERQERKSKKRRRRQYRKLRRASPVSSALQDSEESDSDLDDLFTEHFIHPKKSRVLTSAIADKAANNEKSANCPREFSKVTGFDVAVPPFDSTDMVDAECRILEDATEEDVDKSGMTRMAGHEITSIWKMCHIN